MKRKNMLEKIEFDRAWIYTDQLFKPRLKKQQDIKRRPIKVVE